MRLDAAWCYGAILAFEGGLSVISRERDRCAYSRELLNTGFFLPQNFNDFSVLSIHIYHTAQRKMKLDHAVTRVDLTFNMRTSHITLYLTCDIRCCISLVFPLYHIQLI